MKKSIAFLFFCFWASFQLKAQLCISTEHRTDAYWNETQGTWVESSTSNDATLFKFNKAMTMFTHITATIRSTYYISNLEKDGESYIGEIRSDVGNKYSFSIDTENQNINFTYERNNITYLVRHKIKRVFSCED